MLALDLRGPELLLDPFQSIEALVDVFIVLAGNDPRFLFRGAGHKPGELDLMVGECLETNCRQGVRINRILCAQTILLES